MTIKWKWAPVALLWFLLTSILWIIGAGVGLAMTYWHAKKLRFSRTGTDQYGELCWEWDSPFMRRWFQTTDNGALPKWYWTREGNDAEDYTQRHLVWRTVWEWAGRRNAFGGNPWNMRNFPGDEVLFKSDSGSATRLTVRLTQGWMDGKWAYLITQSEHEPWKMGVWWLRKMKPAEKKPYRHFEIRHGYKFYPDREMADARFSVWDTGVRS